MSCNSPNHFSLSELVFGPYLVISLKILAAAEFSPMSIAPGPREGDEYPRRFIQNMCLRDRL